MNKIFFAGAFSILVVLSSCTPSSVTPTPSISTGTNFVDTGTIEVPVVALPLTPFIARGTEPFWAFEQTATGAKYSAPGISGVDEFFYTTVQTNSGVQIIVVASPISSGGIVNLILTPGACSDGMSDVVYSYSASGTLGIQPLVGCAN